MSNKNTHSFLNLLKVGRREWAGVVVVIAFKWLIQTHNQFIIKYLQLKK